MGVAKKSSDIGLRQGKKLCNMSADERLKFIAKGAPIILESARSLLYASRALKNFPREAEVLRRQAEEESAKILILVDIARCPPKILASRIGDMMTWFYDHLARLLYAKAQGWKAVNITQLQSYIDGDRQSHYLEGQHSEYIMPNLELLNRELALYVDIISDENTDITWCSPLISPSPMEFFGTYDPVSFIVADGLEALGAFTERGMRIMRDVWGSVDFRGDQHCDPCHELLREMWDTLYAKGLQMEDRMTDSHAHNLVNNWQMPMYHIDFRQIDIPLEDLRSERDSIVP